MTWTVKAPVTFLLLLAASCGPREAPPIAVLRAPAAAGATASAAPVRTVELTLGAERRRILPGGKAWRLATGGEAGRLQLGAGGRGAGLVVEVDLVDGDDRRPLLRLPLPAGRFADRAVPVPATRGAVIEGRLAGCGGPSCGWSATAFVPDGRARFPEADPPNVLVILTDTLRADALGSYGATDGRSPTLDALARSGTRFAQARAAASWTLPSVASLFTSRWSYEAGNWAQMLQFLPARNLTLAELFDDAGYATAAFSSSAIVTYDTGFGQGVGTFWAWPIERAVKKPAAGEVIGHAIPWLRAQQRRPFFTYIHLQDPHAPYCLARDQPDDLAKAAGNADAAIQGERPLPDAAELAQWRELYAANVAEVDQAVARVLAALAPDVRARTLIVFVSDHGEEFLEHGFLGHAWSLYDELLRVPFLVAGPGVPAGLVVEAPVSLVDVLPTLAARTGVPVPEAHRRLWRGIDLSPAFAGKPLPARRLLLAETHSYGPARISIQSGPWKAILFNKGSHQAGEMTAPANDVVDRLLPREALFDLAADPGERQNLADGPEGGEFLARARDLALDHAVETIPGRWLAVRGPGLGGTIEGTVRYAGPVADLVPYFLREGDEIAAAGDQVRIRLRDDGAVRAWVTLDHPDLRPVAADLRLAGTPLPARPFTTIGTLPPATWAERPTRRPAAPPEVAGDYVRRLRALGYIR